MRNRPLSRAAVLLTALSLVLMSAGTAFADQIDVDGDIFRVGNDIKYVASPGTGERACSTRGTALANAVSGDAELSYSGGGTNHFVSGETADVTYTGAPSGVTINGPATTVLPTWASGSTHTVNFTTNVATSVADGSYPITVTISGQTSGQEKHQAFVLSIACSGGSSGPINQAPDVTATWNPASIGCRVASTLNVNFTDADSTSWTAAIDWEYDGSNFDDAESVGSVTPGPQVPSFSATHAYNAPGTYTAAVQVTDNQGAVGSDTDALTVNQTYSANFLQPLDGSSPSRLIANTMKKGRVVPVKITITDDCTLLPVNDPNTAVGVKVTTAAFTATATDAVESFSDAGQSAGQLAFFRWSADSSIAGGGFWIFNLDSTGMSVGTCYKVEATIGGITASNYALLKPTK
jgi:hypothetical protein